MLMMAAFACLSIYTFSAETGTESAERSGQLTEWVRENVAEHVENSETGRKVAEKVKELVVRYSPYGSNWDQNIRKLAHFSEYFLLATLLYIVLSILKVPWWMKLFLVVGACGLVACFDELHQGSVAGRGMSAKDVLIDTAGAFTATLIYTILGRFWKWLGS